MLVLVCFKSVTTYVPTAHLLFLDIDECYENPRICLNGRCDNTQGSYTCTCLPGFIESSDKTFCIDLDECANTGKVACFS